MMSVMDVVVNAVVAALASALALHAGFGLGATRPPAFAGVWTAKRFLHRATTMVDRRVTAAMITLIGLASCTALPG